MAIIGWFIAAHFFGPNSARGIAQTIAELQSDSTALQGDFWPNCEYTNLSDMITDFNKIKSYGDPFRYGHTSLDSARVYGHPRMAELARYNVAKCDSVINKASPLWRANAALLLHDQLKGINANTIVRFNKNDEDKTALEIYSIRYIIKDEIDKDADEYNYYLRQLGFKSVLYSASPDNEGIEYTFN